MNASISFFLLFFVSLSFLPKHFSVSSTAIGITYTSPVSPSLPPERIASTVSALHFHSLRLPNPNPTLIRCFSFTNTSLFLSIPNTSLLPLGSNRSLAVRWLSANVLPFYPRSKISLISVGDDAAVSPDLASFLLPALRNLRHSLLDLGITKISVSTTFSFKSAITSPFPPSSAMFQEPLGELVIKPLLNFLDEFNSSFVIKIYPYNIYMTNPEVPLGFALFQDYPFNFRDDLITGVRYRNLFDMMVDAVVTALAVAGHQHIPVVVAETGWPSKGGDNAEVDATLAYAETYVKGLVGHLRSGLGTPLRKEGVAAAYIFELADKQEEEEHGVRTWGILYPNLTEKYNVEFSGGCRIDLGVVSWLSIFLLMVGFSVF